MAEDDAVHSHSGTPIDPTAMMTDSQNTGEVPQIEPQTEPTATEPAKSPLPPPPQEKPQPAPPPPSGGVKETLEAILVAFILAFIFRCFVLEPFVIPTGSMAPTLLGAHFRHTCPDCGYRFDTNFSPPGGGDDMEIPDHIAGKTSAVRCPNCGLQLPLANDPPIFNGDRILVLKYIYLLQEPRRWDVVVFKSPDRPATYNYSQAYIKRLVGRPGEWLMVLDGDIYIADQEKGPYTIQTKTRAAQEALWRIIYDNDYHPLNQPQYIKDGRLDRKWEQPWRDIGGDTKWDTGDMTDRVTSHAFTFQGLNGMGTLEFDPSKDRPASFPAFRDWLAYDQTSDSGPTQGQNTVRDLKLQFDYLRQAGDGNLRLTLTKFDDIFYLDILPTTIKLTHMLRDKMMSVDTAPLPSQGKRPVHVEFSNVDYRVTARINGVDLLQTSSDQYHPNIEELKDWDSRRRPDRAPPIVAIAATHQECQLEHISLWRDIYYTPVDTGRGHSQGGPNNPAHMGPDEYFVCGDNSAFSFDSRGWVEPTNLPDESLYAEPGRVPGRFMLGKAFFVYWPAGFRPGERSFRVIPNFGEMRFIR